MMSSENLEKLEDRMATSLALIENFDPGTDEYKACKEEIEMLSRVLNEDHKLTLEQQKQTYESLKDTADEKERKMDRWFKAGLGVLGVGASVLGCVFNLKALKLALGFETNGTFTAKAGMEALRRALTNRL